MDQLILNISPPEKKTFDNYVFGKNAEIVATLKDFDSKNCGFQIIYLWGVEGSGKSHLLNALKNPLIEKIEDVQDMDTQEHTKLFNLINEIKSNDKKIIITGNQSPDEIKNMREDLLSRLKWGLVMHIKPLSDEDKFKVITNQSQERGFYIEEKVIQYCLRHLRRDLHTLINTLHALDEWSLKTKRPITINLLKELLNKKII
ncbi:MAG: DnaA/Hda family protein [Proteobacteria bacterium]|nr:DnaA/Hda family protein [Pseudomonadota bacterium]MDA0942336.1 DnaA/Hda family protein [Pseudomonadota bacterium]MDA1035114.1 DnaA/Hda family protein [Pseudomonadota bacterium]